jgi:hypothetical protein
VKSKKEPYTARLQMIMKFDDMAVISVQSSIDLNDYYRIS